MLLISLMLAAASQPAAGPGAAVQPRHAPRPASSPARSKRLIELEAAVKSLPLAAAGSQDRRSGPSGM